jgi:recombination protein RecT
MSNPNTSITLSEYMHKPEAITRFADILGNSKSAQSYIESVLILVENDDTLKECTLKSIYIAAKRAASLGLSCDKSLKQAWLIAYDVKVKARNVKQGDKMVTIPEHYEKQAQFQPHYMGLYNLAMRTNLYRHINVSPVYEGQRVLQNTLTGLHVVVDAAGNKNSFAHLPEAYNEGWSDVTTRRVEKDRVRIGWIAYFKTWKGFEKSIYMTVDEIEEHAQKYVKGYMDDKGKIKNPNWADPVKRITMEMKTALRQLLSWADKTGSESQKLTEALQADENVVDANYEEAPEELPSKKIDMHPMTIEEARDAITVLNGKEIALGNITNPDQLRAIAENEQFGLMEAAKLILKVDFNFDEAETPKSKETNLKELGF